MNRSNVKITIVEDDCFYGEILRKYVIQLTGRLVPAENTEVIHHTTAEECLTHLDPLTDIFILDHNLGVKEKDHLTGLELLQIIQNKCPGSRYVIVTNHCDYPTINKFSLQGAHRYILKNQETPINLRTALCQLLDRRSVIQ